MVEGTPPTMGSLPASVSAMRSNRKSAPDSSRSSSSHRGRLHIIASIGDEPEDVGEGFLTRGDLCGHEFERRLGVFTGLWGRFAPRLQAEHIVPLSVQVRYVIGE